MIKDIPQNFSRSETLSLLLLIHILRIKKTPFYRRSKFKLVHEDHRSRTLITEFEPNIEEQKSQQRQNCYQRIFIANCHLSGGPKSSERVSQINSVVKSCRKRMQTLVCLL